MVESIEKPENPQTIQEMLTQASEKVNEESWTALNLGDRSFETTKKIGSVFEETLRSGGLKDFYVSVQHREKGSETFYVHVELSDETEISHELMLKLDPVT